MPWPTLQTRPWRGLKIIGTERGVAGRSPAQGCSMRSKSTASGIDCRASSSSCAKRAGSGVRSQLLMSARPATRMRSPRRQNTSLREVSVMLAEGADGPQGAVKE